MLLLDEMEKSHPVVWNTFLQAFDAGRLTDSRGTTVEFGSVVIVMTSNIGAAEASAAPIGFGTAGADLNRARERTVRGVTEAMPRELVNRIDEMVVFDPLGMDAITQIAGRELERARHRLAESGWLVSYDHDVVRYLATTGYDPAYGARHLRRNIERLFLALIGESETKRVSVHVVNGDLVLERS
jgi:ATP-dependent Clp protease ATP-binding subunit ClpA